MAVFGVVNHHIVVYTIHLHRRTICAHTSAHRYGYNDIAHVRISAVRLLLNVRHVVVLAAKVRCLARVLPRAVRRPPPPDKNIQTETVTLVC